VNYTGAIAAAAHSRATTKAALGAICGRVVGVSVLPQFGTCNGQADLEDFATATGALVPPAAWDVGVRPAGCAATQCCTGINGAGRAPNAQGLCPMVFQTSSNGTGLGAGVVTGIRMLTRFAKFDVVSEKLGVTTDIAGVPLPTPHTTADFIRAITPTVSFMLPPPPPNLPGADLRRDRRSTASRRARRCRSTCRRSTTSCRATNDAQIFRANDPGAGRRLHAARSARGADPVPPSPVIVQ
jgi:hypothetical protein